jgi:hypothetical protein
MYTQGCGNTERFCLSLDKLSEKSYLSCLFFKHSILANIVAAMLVHEFQGGLFLKVLPLDNQ